MFGLLRSFRTQTLKRGFASNNYKDYYGVLGLTNQASPEEIVSAYKALAVNYHNGFTHGRTGLEQSQENAQFEQISEAYAVLSDTTQRFNYDRTNVGNPEILRQQITQEREVRGSDGNRLGHGDTDNVYAHEFKSFLTKQRGRFNVDSNSTYRGGVLKRGAGRVRGNALAEPGAFHTEDAHRDLSNPFSTELYVDNNKVTEYSNLKECKLKQPPF